MKNIFSSTFLLLITFLIKFPLYSSEDEERSVLDYYRGEKVETNDDNEEPNDCICDTNIGSCDYLCCCDKDCHEEAIKEWRDRHKCMDEQDTVGIFADRCIDQNLVVFSNNRRGLKKDIQSEDIPNRDATINNFCYSMDNSGKMTKNIKSLNDLKEFEIDNKKLDKLIDKINQVNIDIGTDSRNKNNKKHDYLKIYIEGDFLRISEEDIYYFSLFSGPSCKTSKKVEMLVPENYSCLMNKNNEILTEDILKTIKINDIKENPNIKHYYINNGIIQTVSHLSESNIIIVEVEFIVQMNKSKYKIEKLCINIVFKNEEKEDFYPFKNSIKFIQEECGNDNNLKNPYRYSGNGGYLNDYPLKIYNSEKNKVYNEYYIVGRDKDGNCRDNNDDIDEYLYDSDIPINFKQDYSYHCTKKNNNDKIIDTLLYKKISGISKIGRYGSSFYNNIDDEEDWVTVNPFDYKDDCNIIKMNVYIGTIRIGYYSHKYIYRTDILCLKEKGNDFWFNIKYYDLEGDDDNDKKYNKSPDYPTFVPNIPEDILDPLINSDVDK